MLSSFCIFEYSRDTTGGFNIFINCHYCREAHEVCKGPKLRGLLFQNFEKLSKMYPIL